MSLAVLHSRALVGLVVPPVTAEVHLGNGLPAFTIVGLPEAEVVDAGAELTRVRPMNAQVSR